MLKSKIHRATVTNANLNYEGSISIDEDLLKKADILLCQLICKLKMIYGLKLSFKVTIRLNTKCSGE